VSVDVGDEAPDFELPDQTRTPVRLSSFRGRKKVVVVFYPLSFTGVCQGELCAIRDSIHDFEGDDVQVLAISCDSTATHAKWADEQGYTFPFIVDLDGKVAYKVVNAIPDARDLDQYTNVLAAL
jgi:peroxiredoxin